MFQNKLKIAFRNFKKNKTFSFINILGLSLGMACCFLIVLYCWYEFNYDNFHQNGDRLYRIQYNMDRGSISRLSRTPATIAPAMDDYFPEVEAISRFYPRELGVELPDTRQQYEMENVFFVDSSALDVFQFDFLHGNPKLALHRPDAVVITDKVAMQLFGTTDAIGKPLRLAGEDGFQVTGIVKSWPDNSHLEFNILLPFKSIIKVEPAHARKGIAQFIASNWSATYCFTYVKLKPNQDPKKVDDRFVSFIQEKGQEGLKDKQSFNLVPIQDIHLLAEGGGPKPSGNLSYLYLFLLIGILTLTIACINFVNLSTANSIKRAQEIGVRKVLGAQRSELITQFLGESLLLSFFAFLISFVITLLLLPSLNQLTGINIPYSYLIHPIILGSFSVIFLLTGFFAGLYPAFFVSKFQPKTVLKGTGTSQQKPWNDLLRKGLITLQFLAAIGFIAGSITIYLQIKYLTNQPLGFNKNLTLSIPLDSGNNLNAILRPGDATLRQRMNAFDESLSSNPNILAVTQCSRLPGLGSISQHISTPSKPKVENLITNTLSVDYDFTETFDLEVIAGRDFDASFGSDHIGAFVVNEQAINFLDWENPEKAIGQKLTLGGKEGMVIGVLKDFHFESLHSEINPMVMEVRPGSFGYFALQIQNSNIQETLGFLEGKWKTAFPSKAFEYTFLDETINETYLVERRLASIISYAAFLTIFIACFGLFGLAALMTQHRFREIGIRKVLGASVSQILALIAKDFMKLIAIAMLIATPLTWFFMSGWLAEFAYRINFPWWTTLASGFAIMLVAFITISAQSMKAAFSNPVEAIREE